VEAIVKATARKFDLSKYMRLVRQVPLVPIVNEQQLDQAIQMVNRLVDVRWKRDRTREEDAYLEVLSHLIAKYEDVAYPVQSVDDSALLAHLLEARGETQAALARGVGIAESTISEVLRGKRRFTRTQIGKVATWFKVSPELFSTAG
jgi:HTH-type transcriptional regulator/antitoxin HigA